MKRSTIVWLIIAASLILIGGILFVSVMSALNWDFIKLSTGTYETNTHEINEDLNAISIHTDTADIVFVPADNGECSVVCYEQSSSKHTVSVKDGTLTIEVTNTKKWYEYIGINYGSPKITVYLPKAEYSALKIKESTGDIEIPNNFRFENVDIAVSTGDVKCSTSVTGAIKISASTGDVSLENMSAGSLNLSTSTGDITVSGAVCEGDLSLRVTTGKTRLTDMTCKNITSSGNTGDISLKNVIATETITVKRSTGDVNFDSSDAAEIFVTTDTGDVSGSLLSEKVFLIKTDTGDVSVPDSVTGGRCEITTDTGDIKISIHK